MIVRETMVSEKLLARTESSLRHAWALWIFGVSLAGCLALFVVKSWKWPLVGDASLYHYVAFLIDHGFVPYRRIVEINMPGCYAVHWIVIHALGGGPLSWRLFDLALMAAIGIFMILITRPYGPYGWFAGFAGAGLLTLIHGQDGIPFLGERDQVMAALFACAFAFLFLALRRNSPWMIWPAALAAGVAITMKPWAAPAGILLLLLLVFRLKSLQRRWTRPFFYGVIGLLLPGLLVCGYLLRVHAFGAFVQTMTGLGLYYNGMYRRPLGFLLSHSIAPVGPLVAIWLILTAARRQWRRWNWERWMLAGGALFSLAAYCAQGRGFPYYRYPLLMFLLTLMGIDFAACFEHPKLRYLAALGSAYALLVLAPQCTFKAIRYDWHNQEFISMLSADLGTLGGQRLSGGVQCFDTTVGCINTLYDLKLLQATGFVYDCYGYAPRGSEMAWVVDRFRRDFLAALNASSPKVLVVTSQYCQAGPDGYEKLKRWPVLDAWIGERYKLYAERTPPDDIYWWSRVMKPSGYRIYVSK